MSLSSTTWPVSNEATRGPGWMPQSRRPATLILFRSEQRITQRHQTHRKHPMATFKDLTDYLHEVGAAEVTHTEKGYLAHAIGVYNDLKKWGWDEELARAGIFHSIYGTELFQRFKLPLEQRGEVRELIGERAEFLCWLNCAMDRPHFDRELLKPAGPYQILDRFSGELVNVSDEDFDALGFMHLCDWLEQVGRSRGFDYRRTGYRDLAHRVGGVGLENYERVFAEAPEQTWTDEYQWPQTVPR